MPCEDVLKEKVPSLGMCMLLSRHTKALQFFLQLSDRYGEIARFWNDLPVLQLKPKQSKKKTQPKRKSVSKSKRTKCTRRTTLKKSKREPTPPPSPRSRPRPKLRRSPRLKRRPSPASDTEVPSAVKKYFKNQFDELKELMAQQQRPVPHPNHEDRRRRSRSRSPSRVGRTRPSRRSNRRHSHSPPHDRRSRGHKRRRRSARSLSYDDSQSVSDTTGSSRESTPRKHKHKRGRSVRQVKNVFIVPSYPHSFPNPTMNSIYQQPNRPSAFQLLLGRNQQLGNGFFQTYS